MNKGRFILRTDSVTKNFGGVRAVQEVTLSVKEGSICGLIGPNGSGKSTLFNLITGVLKPDSGHIYFYDKNIEGLEPERIYKLGISRTFQSPRLFAGMTVLDNAMIPPKEQIGEHPLISLLRSRWYIQEKELSKQVKSNLDFVGLTALHNKLPTEISGGQMKLLQLSLIFSSKPKLVLLDEPTAGVSPPLARQIFNHIQDERQRNGTTFFIIEHRLDTLFKCVEHVFVMHEGRLISEGPPDKVVKDQKVISAYLGKAYDRNTP
jgi:branched-chain amino acid transport system ATP-binding protein